MHFFQKIKNRFIAGLLIVFPALVTVLLLKWLFGFVSRWITPFIIKFCIIIGLRDILSHQVFQHLIPLIGIILTFLTVLGIGLLGANIIGKRVIRDFDRLMMRIPLVKAVYGSARQLLDSFDSSGKNAFREVVMLEYPRKGIYSIGFLDAANSRAPRPGAHEYLYPDHAEPHVRISPHGST
jgi:uncharacterized membrane protein